MGRLTELFACHLDGSVMLSSGSCATYNQIFYFSMLSTHKNPFLFLLFSKYSLERKKIEKAEIHNIIYAMSNGV
jgi:hypothetical protein